MRLLKLPTLALAAAVVGACGTDKAIGPGGIGPKTTVSMNFCALAVPSWLAVQNTGGAWTRLSPNTQGVLTFDATEKVSVAIVLDFLGSSITQVLNVSAAELQGANLISCEGGFGSNLVSGSAAGLTGEQVARISGANSQAGASASATNWELTGLPTGTIDVVATRFATAFTQPADRIIIRRGIIPNAQGTPISTLDFGAAESHAFESNTVTFTGVASDFVNVGTDLVTVNGTFHTLGFLSSISASAFNYVSVPAALRVATDFHILTGFAANSNGDREITHFYNTPANKTLVFGPMVSTPTLNTISTSPNLRVRAIVPAQAEYPTAMLVEFGQAIGQLGSRSVIVITTAGFLGGAPATWDLAVPDMSRAGYQPAWGLSNSGYGWSVTGFSGDINVLVGGTPIDGATITTATRVSFATALRADRATLRGRPALRTFGAPTQFRGASWRRASTRSSN